VLLDKPEAHKTDVTFDYIGYSIKNEFVVGYGLDFAEKYRNLPFIGILKEELYKC
jgi:hypoxanthine phosphoribosyltransferase